MTSLISFFLGIFRKGGVSLWMFKNRPPHSSTPPCWPFYMSCHIWAAAAAAQAAAMASMAPYCFFFGQESAAFFFWSFLSLVFFR
ncbi:hypothetical protein B0T26DRAFT_3411 [Lasiosphaeria miniovina]|uniref:Uncharacterized protein n=1 Tax=Lasiosphaeria miniovina TaxID=1954250 RepID=A0AA40BFI2_9PEZI|nr:uncharacterized protein B0T26DRAFT_3411 [Lasiosphaeria miniovina]KAK0732998.1 hypothetical protein B0T26DRAFT_3411 [Lasiosphaeria miniovina]